MNLNLEDLTLAVGSHNDRNDGVCLMEAVAWFAGEPHDDHPQCVDPLLTKIAIRFNDDWSDENRQKLKAMIPFMAGTNGSAELTARRSWFILDRIVRWHLPKTLHDCPGLIANIACLESLPPIASQQSALTALGSLRVIEKNIHDYASGALVSTPFAAPAFTAPAFGAPAFVDFVDFVAVFAADSSASAAFLDFAVPFSAVASAIAFNAFDATLAATGRISRDRSCDRMVSILRDACLIT